VALSRTGEDGFYLASSNRFDLALRMSCCLAGVGLRFCRPCVKWAFVFQFSFLRQRTRLIWKPSMALRTIRHSSPVGTSDIQTGS
jgi:hypothetical protein